MIERCIECDKTFFRRATEHWKVRCPTCYFKRRAQEEIKESKKGSNGDVDKLHTYVDFMIFACHPDRNPGREATANEVTKWLLDIRRSARRK